MLAVPDLSGGDAASTSDVRRATRATHRRPLRLAAAAAAALLLGGATLVHAADRRGDGPLVVAASNTTTNQLLVIGTDGRLLEAIPTQGQGGVSGNAGGVAASHGRVAVVNYGSNNVSLFARDPGGQHLRLEQVVPTQASPVSVAFGHDHLYVLTASAVESHALGPRGADSTADGVAPLLHADASAAQVGVVGHQLIVTEKSNAIETVDLGPRGAVAGPATMVANLPSNVDTPLGLATRGDNAYVTIAHADETALVRNGQVLTVTGSGTQHAPCWLALDGPFLFSANSPSRSVSRYTVTGQRIVQDAAVAASFTGSPTDIAYGSGLAAVIDASGNQSRVSVFEVDEDGNLTLSGVATIAGKATNGVAVVGDD